MTKQEIISAFAVWSFGGDIKTIESELKSLKLIPESESYYIFRHWQNKEDPDIIFKSSLSIDKSLYDYTKKYEEFIIFKGGE